MHDYFLEFLTKEKTMSKTRSFNEYNLTKVPMEIFYLRLFITQISVLILNLEGWKLTQISKCNENC